MTQEDLIKQTQNKFANPWVGAIFLTYIAYTGRLGTVSRILMGATGVALLYKNYQIVKYKNPNATLKDHIIAYSEGITNKEDV